MTAPLVLLHGRPPPRLATPPVGAVQTSPLIPGSRALDDVADGAADEAIVLAPPGTLERRFTLAHALRALRPGGRLLALAPKAQGGSRLAGDLEALGVADFGETSKAHHRLCEAERPLDAPAFAARLAAAIEAGAPRRVPGLDLVSQPGVFAWDRLDPGTALLIAHLPPLAGRGIDLGCGAGAAARAVLAMREVRALALVDVDRRAIACARENFASDGRTSFHWVDVRAGAPATGLDFAVMNPPFHDGGTEDRALGQAFVRAAAGALRKGGRLILVANRHLPYEATLAEAFAAVSPVAEADGYKVLEATR